MLFFKAGNGGDFFYNKIKLNFGLIVSVGKSIKVL